MAGDHRYFYWDERNITSDTEVYLSLYSIDYYGIDE